MIKKKLISIDKGPLNNKHVNQYGDQDDKKKKRKS